MDGIRQYILGVICVVTLCAVAQMLYSSSLVKLLCGLVVTITVLQPLSGNRIFHWDGMLSELMADKEAAVEDGRSHVYESLTEIISQKTQAYILSKASELGANVRIVVQLQDEYPYLPQTVTVDGGVSPYVKQQLSECLRQDLGIAKENQIWTS